MAKEPTPPDQAGKEAITEEQQPQKKGKLAGILPVVLGVTFMAGMAWAFTQFVLVRTIEDSLKGVLAESSAEGGSEETTANEGEPSEDDGQASEGSADHSNAAEGHAPSSDGHGGSGTEEGGETFKDPYQIESALVNIKSTNASRFLVVSITIDSGQDAQRPALYKILKAKDAFIRDMALEILSEFSMEDLADEPAAKNKVKIQMQERLSQYITDKKLDYSVLFTQWAIQ